MNDADLRAHLARRLAAAPGRTRRRRERRDAAIVVAGLAMALGVFLAAGGFREAGQDYARDGVLVLTTTLGTAAIAIGAFSFAIGPRRTLAGSLQRTALLLALAAPVAVLAWKVGWSDVFGETNVELRRLGLRCFGLSFPISGAILAAMLAVRRRTELVSPTAAGIALGIASGASGAVLVDLWCPVGAWFHVLLGHVVPMAILGLVGGVAGSLVLRAPPPPR